MSEQTIQELKEELDSYKLDGVVGYYYQLNKWINGTVELMKEKGVKSLLSADKADGDNKKFERVMALIKNTKEWIDTMADLRVRLRITGDEEKDLKAPVIRITPETMADNIGELAGQKK